MELRLRRIALKGEYTIGKLEVYKNGQWAYLCDTLEDKVIDINKNGCFDGKEEKVYGKSAIPYGKYAITMNVPSPKYSDYSRYAYARPYQAYMPRLVNVKHFDGILIHPGSTAAHSAGCILVGRNTIVGKLTESQNIWRSLMDNYFMPAKRTKEPITIDIV